MSSTASSSSVTNSVAPEVVDASSSLSPEELHAQRGLKALERDKRIKENHIQAAKLVKFADKLVEKSKFKDAIPIYAEASRKWTTNADILVKYARACLSTDQYGEAEILTRQALDMNPKNIDARFCRGIARLGRGDPKGAKVDLSTIVEHVPDQVAAKEVLDLVSSLLGSLEDELEDEELATVLEAIQEGLDWAYHAGPKYDDVGIDYADISDSEDSKLRGNEVTCKHHNRKAEGCREGLKCKWLHGADVRSVRDRLGRNVCAYHLFGTCRFEEYCFYSHDTEWLPSKGWWKHDAQLERMKKIVAKFESDSHAFKLQQELLEALKAISPPPGDGGSAAQSKKKSKKSKKKKRSKSGKKKAPPPLNHAAMWLDMMDEDDSDEMEERANNFGFTRAEVGELMCQGVKPWDDDAWDVMDALTSM